jgi:hypothetical protein
MSDEKKKKDEEAIEEERVDDALAGEHTYEPGGETPDYIRDFVDALAKPRPVARGE